ncbi:efflux RND transporter periplasmic adaptor subunit [Flavivirga rizhaonensis]|uniref:HlyD family efflux transporter periplasmic adaptor subunit n=1 Tax=Flavivirga rizhaonensis TaxID=2559571 RepID=A0A4S1E1X9_9FLAO|nr:HlyD family efflux transporter periplasmic adaptor subunit [Flavivirga rizhaonensis]TGV04343.1 HlyD family efflux transporter periplasmic adaptor subunit [Flavivirga rizhaonensis]
MKLIRLICILLTIVSCSENKDKILPTERNLTESVYSSVTIQPDSLYQVYAIVAGILDENLVEEGDVVSKDTILMQIINNTPKLNTQNAKLALDLAKENYSGSAAVLDGIKDEIVAARLKHINDSINYYRQKKLWKQQIGSKLQYDTKKLNYELASNNLKLIQSRYNRTKNELQTQVRQAENNYKKSLITTKDFAVKSKINGKVYALYKEPGEIITTTEPLASIGSATRFIIEMLIDEVDIVRISENQEVIIHLDAYNGDVFTGKVSKIYPKKDERNQTFKVEAVFKNLPNVLYPGLSGEANIIIAKKDSVLTIPKAYLVDDDKVKTDDGLIPIKTGLQNLEYIEVLSGITKDTPIYKPE